MGSANLSRPGAALGCALVTSARPASRRLRHSFLAAVPESRYRKTCARRLVASLNRFLWLVPHYAGDPVRVLNPKNTMCGNSFRLMRRSAVGIVIAIVLLAGCAAEQQSLKDDMAPSVAGYRATTPAVTKVSIPAPPRPPAQRQPDAKALVDTSGCGSNSGCLARLKVLLDDPSRKWVGQPQPPAEHADGTRQFAYRALRTKLSCKELTLAIEDIAAATRTFRASVAGVAPEQVAHVRTLNGQVEAELRAERTSRCST